MAGKDVSVANVELDMSASSDACLSPLLRRVLFPLPLLLLCLRSASLAFRLSSRPRRPSGFEDPGDVGNALIVLAVLAVISCSTASDKGSRLSSPSSSSSERLASISKLSLEARSAAGSVDGAAGGVMGVSIDMSEKRLPFEKRCRQASKTR